MAVDFEISDWGDNGLSDLHSVLFDHKGSQVNETTAKKNQWKKKKQRTNDKADREVKPIKLVTPEEDIKKKQKHKKQEKAKITETNGTHKATKRKSKDDLQSPVSKKKKSVKKAEKRKIMEGDDEGEESRNETETEDKVDKEEKKKKKQKKKKLDESQEGTKPSESEVIEGKVKRKNKRKKKAVNKFKTEEFLNSKKLCGKFVDLTTPPPKVPTKVHDVIPIKEKHSEITQHPKEGKKKQTNKKQKEKHEKENKEQPNENHPSTDIVDKTKATESNKKKPIDLRTKMENKLKGARFRFINEKLYTCTGDSALELFTEDKDAFQVYHDGFVEQVKCWPINPVDKMIEDLKKMPSSKIVGDFGCGDAKIAKSVKQTVHSFDLVSTNNNIIACNMANVPLADNKLDVAVFCLSLMGTNWIDYLKEANRVLKNKGILKISEVSSRFQNLKAFILAMKRLGFSQIHKDTSNKFFISLDFKKQNSPKEISEGMNEILKPCLYKKR